MCLVSPFKCGISVSGSTLVLQTKRASSNLVSRSMDMDINNKTYVIQALTAILLFLYLYLDYKIK